MKFVLAATFAVLSTSASAGGFLYNAYGEYAVEGESFEFGLGAEYFTGPVSLSAGLTLVKPNGTDLDIDSVDLGASYSLNHDVTLYGNVEFDQNLDYTETTVGVAFSF